LLGDRHLLLVAAAQRRRLWHRSPRHTHFERAARRGPGQLALGLAVDQAERTGQLAEVQCGDIGGDRHVEEHARALAVLGEIDEAALTMHRCSLRMRKRLAVKPRRCRDITGLQATDAWAISVRPAPMRPPMPRISPRPELED
jgi:hypothetical protein